MKAVVLAMPALAALLCSVATAQDKVGPLSGMRLPVWDWLQEDHPVTRRYVYMVPGADFAVVRGADGITWELRLANPPLPGPVIRFDPKDFRVTQVDGEISVRIRWPMTIAGELAAKESDFPLPGFKAPPDTCLVYRNGLRLSLWKLDWELAAPLQEGGDWLLRFPAWESESLIVAVCAPAP